MSHRFTRFIGIAGAAALAGLAACSDSTAPSSTSNATAVTDSSASNSLLSNFFGLGNTVTVTIDSSSVAVGHNAHAVASIRDMRGNAVSGSVSWSSSNSKMASVTSNGSVTGVAVGSATITASYLGKSGKATLKVIAAPTAPTTSAVAALAIAMSTTSIVAGKSVQATYKFLDASGKVITTSVPITWASQNSNIATVSQSGLVTGVAAGTTTLGAYTSDMKYGSIQVTVTAATSTAPSQPTTPSQPTAPTQPTQPSQPTGSGNLATADFENGGYGSMLAETPGHLSIIADPTNSGHGKVMQVSFTGSGASADLNQFASWNPTSGLSHGSTFYFRGQVFFPANTANFNAPLRKLIYFRTNLGTSGGQFDYVVNMFGTDVGLEMTGPSQTDARWDTHFQMPLGQWVTLEVEIAMNSKPGAKDGSTTVWINGNQVVQVNNVAFTAASDPTTTRWSWLAVGTQREGAAGDATISEVRYWDNIAWGTSRIGN
jgi:uncharacterized protein YjdB